MVFAFFKMNFNFFISNFNEKKVSVLKNKRGKLYIKKIGQFQETRLRFCVGCEISLTLLCDDIDSCEPPIRFGVFKG